MAYLLFALLAVVAFAFGRYGHSHVDVFVPVTRNDRERAYKEKMVRRGTIACQVAAGFMVLGLILQATGALGG